MRLLIQYYLKIILNLNIKFSFQNSIRNLTETSFKVSGNLTIQTNYELNLR